MNFIGGAVTLFFAWLLTHFLVKEYGLTGAGMSTSVAYITMTTFIMAAFIFTGKNVTGDLKLLLPAKSDYTALKNIFKKLN